MNIKNEILKLKKTIALHELADDGYYLSRQYKEDYRALAELQNLLKNTTPSPHDLSKKT